MMKTIYQIIFFGLFSVVAMSVNANVVLQDIQYTGEKVRSGRATFDYKYKVLVHNDSTDRLINVVGVASSSNRHISVIDSDFTIKKMCEGCVVLSSGTITLRIDRRGTFNKNSIEVAFTSEIEPSVLEVFDFGFVELKGRPAHESLFPIFGEPIAGAAVIFNATVNMLPDNSFVKFISLDDESTIATYTLDSNANNFLPVGFPLVETPTSESDFVYLYGNVTIPNAPFKIQLTSIIDEVEMVINADHTFYPNTISLSVEPLMSIIEAGAINLVNVRVSNNGNVLDAYTLTATDTKDFLVNVVSHELTLNPGDSQVVTLELSPASTTPRFTVDELMVQVTSNTDVANTNTYKLKLYVE